MGRAGNKMVHSGHQRICKIKITTSTNTSTAYKQAEVALAWMDISTAHFIGSASGRHGTGAAPRGSAGTAKRRDAIKFQVYANKNRPQHGYRSFHSSLRTLKAMSNI